MLTLHISLSHPLDMGRLQQKLAIAGLSSSHIRPRGGYRDNDYSMLGRYSCRYAWEPLMSSAL